MLQLLTLFLYQNLRKNIDTVIHPDKFVDLLLLRFGEKKLFTESCQLVYIAIRMVLLLDEIPFA